MDRRRIRGEGASGEVRVQAPGPLDHSPASAIPAGDAISAAHGQGALTRQHVRVVEPAADRVASAMQLTTCSPPAEVPYPPESRRHEPARRPEPTTRLEHRHHNPIRHGVAPHETSGVAALELTATEPQAVQDRSHPRTGHHDPPHLRSPKDPGRPGRRMLRSPVRSSSPGRGRRCGIRRCLPRISQPTRRSATKVSPSERTGATT